MKNKLIEISDIKQITSLSKSCKFDSGCTLESKYGKIVLNINPEAKKVILHLKRLSGNGKIIINDDNIIITSKLSHCYELAVQPLVEISRPEDGTGEVNLFGVSIYFEEIEKGETLSQNWKTLMARCGEHKGIRLVANKLFAAQGAFITNGSLIKNIQTSPPNMTEMQENKLRFLGQCEIINLIVDTQAPIVPKPAHDLYTHRDAPMPLVVPSELEPVVPPLPLFGNFKQASSPDPPSNPILYDSLIVKEFAPSKQVATNTIKFIKSNFNDYLHLKKGGIYTIPMSFIKPNIEYVVIVNAKRLNGNGKIRASFSSNNQPLISGVEMLTENTMSDIYFNINSGKINNDDIYRFAIGVSEQGTGDVLISRIQVLQGISINAFRNRQKHVQIPTSNVPINFSSTGISINRTMGQISKTFSILQPNVYDTLNTYDLTGVIQTADFKSAQWVSKILPMFPNVQINSASINLLKFTKTDKSTNVVLGSLGSLAPCPRIWVEEFAEEKMSQTDLDIFNNCSTIMSPSLPNIQFFKHKFLDKKIIHVPKYWPHLNKSQSHYSNYLLYFEKHPLFTELLLQNWKSDFPKLFVVGTNYTLPDFAKYISPYASYNYIYSLLMGSSGLIDLNSNNHYSSGILDLAHSCGIRIVTNNHWLSFVKPKPNYVMSKHVSGSILMPDANELIQAISEMLSKPMNSCKLENYNLNLEASFRTMLGTND